MGLVKVSSSRFPLHPTTIQPSPPSRTPINTPHAMLAAIVMYLFGKKVCMCCPP
ncbi:MAG TPA: hypothetical protein PK777_03825 [Thermoguttaceae bacterium]|nr:hypothetical protein [Thermoguttaceae bacterium]